MDDYTKMNLVDVSRLPGIADIKKLPARGAFAQALVAEAKGDHVKAAELLEKAILLDVD